MSEAAVPLVVDDEIHRGEYHRYELALEHGMDRSMATVVFDRVGDENGGIWCEITVTLHLTDGDVIVIPPSRTNLMNATRSGWRTHTDELESRYSSVDWYDLFRDLVTRTIVAHRDGDVAVPLSPVSEQKFEPFLLKPLIAGRGVTVAYGEGGVGKSTLGLAAALSVATGYPVFGDIPRRAGPVIYFDYEDDSMLHDIRLGALMRGFKLDSSALVHTIYHKSLVSKVASSQSSMRKLVAETGAVMVVLDSIGMGRGGDAHGPEDTIRMFRALRSLNVPVLALDHVSHATRKQQVSARKMEDLAPYGSVYTVNSARLLWGALEAAASSDGIKRIQMINTKANHVARQSPFGVTIEHRNDKIVFRVVNEIWEEFDMTTWERLFAVFIMSNEFLSVKELAERIEVSRDTVRKELNRHSDELEEMSSGREKRVRLKKVIDDASD